MSEMGPSADQLRMAVIQQLEAMRRAGLTHWKRLTPIANELLASVPTDVRPAGMKPAIDVLQQPLISKSASTSKTSTSSGLASELKQPAATKLFDDPAITEMVKKKVTAPVPVAAPRPPIQPLNLSLEDRIAGLNILSERVKSCTRCPELVSTRTQTVFGVGNPQAKILFVGEAPGADEDAQGEPFVGKSGQLLNDIIKACRLRREDIYICNVLRCRPPGNRLPAPDECANCREYLEGQIAHVNPEYIVCWGACAAQNLLSSSETIGKLRKRFFTYANAKVICTYHPSYLMRNPAAKKDVWEDMKMLFLDMGVDLTKKA